MKKSRIAFAMILLMTASLSSSASALTLNSQTVTQVLDVLAQICKIAGTFTKNKIPYCDTLAKVTPSINDMATGAEDIARGGTVMDFISGLSTSASGGVDFYKAFFDKNSSATGIANAQNGVVTNATNAYNTGLAKIIQSANGNSNGGTTAIQINALANGQITGVVMGTAAAGMNLAQVNALNVGTGGIDNSVTSAADAYEEAQALLEQSKLAVSTRATIEVTNEILVKMLNYTMATSVNTATLAAQSLQQQAMTTQQINYLVNVTYIDKMQEFYGAQQDMLDGTVYAENYTNQITPTFTAVSGTIALNSTPGNPFTPTLPAPIIP